MTSTLRPALPADDNLALARAVIAEEIVALSDMSVRLGESFNTAVRLIMNTTGRVVVVGMGKSGIIGKKIAASLASTGTAAFFVHPGEAFHGDLGMIRPIDVLLMISNSGETEELIRLLPFLQHQNNHVIAMTGRLDSTLAKHADAVLDIHVKKEACANNLAPTSSTTAALAMGDALTVVLSTRRNFKPEDFARFHPGGNLGKKLLTRVRDVMHKENLPFCAPDDTFRQVVHAITRGRLGMVMVKDRQDLTGCKLEGIITDGDIRRAFESGKDVMAMTARQIMSAQPIKINLNERVGAAEELMRKIKINSLIVEDDHQCIVGVIQFFG